MARGGRSLALVMLGVVLGLGGWATWSTARRAQAPEHPHAQSSTPIEPDTLETDPEIPPLPPVPTLPEGTSLRGVVLRGSAEGDPRLAELSAEMRLLANARHALAAEPARALDLIEQHRQRYPGSPLREHREGYAIEALRALGRSDEAERRLLELAADFPGSEIVRRLSQP